MKGFPFGHILASADSGAGTPPLLPRRRPKIGLALGAGSARGWCHIGVLREFEAMGVKPDIIAGTSIGAVVGGCFAAGRLDELEAFARGMTRMRFLAMLDWSFSGRGLIAGARLRGRLEEGLAETMIEDLPTRFAAVATEAGSGREVWLTRGPLARAIRASYALPGIFESVKVGDHWLFDGAVVNPVPVSVCRALGADIVIAVNIIESAMAFHDAGDAGLPAEPSPEPHGLLGAARGHWLRGWFSRREDGGPSMASVMTDAFNITQDRISRSRLAGDPPDVFVRTRLDHVGLFDFHRARELIEAGREAARRAAPELRQVGLIDASG